MKQSLKFARFNNSYEDASELQRDNELARDLTNEVNFLKHKDALYNIVINAFRHVPYYRSAWTLGDISLKEFDYSYFKNTIVPLNKKLLRDNQLSFLSELCDGKPLHSEMTSGTEGKPICCYRSVEEHLRCSSLLWMKRREIIPDLSPKDKLVRFYAMRNKPSGGLILDDVYVSGNDIHVPLSNMSEEAIIEFWKKVISFKPRWMHGPSTAIFNIAKLILKRGLPGADLEFIELNGEFVSSEQVALIKKAFGCKIANHYGAREFWPIAYSCDSGYLHLANNLFVENYYDNATQRNEILVTTLSNAVWPLIRYRVGDLGNVVHANHKCSCVHNNEFVLEIEKGRRADYFSLKNDQCINAVLFSGIARGLNSKSVSPLLYQYQVIKLSEEHLEIKLCLDTNEPALFVKTFDYEVRKIISQDIQIDYQIVDHIEPDPITGKSKDFISRC